MIKFIDKNHLKIYFRNSSCILCKKYFSEYNILLIFFKNFIHIYNIQTQLLPLTNPDPSHNTSILDLCFYNPTRTNYTAHILTDSVVQMLRLWSSMPLTLLLCSLNNCDMCVFICVCISYMCMYVCIYVCVCVCACVYFKSL